MSLKHTGEDAYRDAAELLAEKMGCEEDDYRPEDMEIPDFENQQIVSKEELEE